MVEPFDEFKRRLFAAEPSDYPDVDPVEFARFKAYLVLIYWPIRATSTHQSSLGQVVDMVPARQYPMGAGGGLPGTIPMQRLTLEQLCARKKWDNVFPPSPWRVYG